MAGRTLLTALPTHERRLDNGLTVLVREDHSAPVVAIVTHVRAGYFDEPDKLIGISHVLEHMYFKGTERRNAGDIARETKAAGGYLNAGTIYDHTSYYTVLPSSALEQGIDIQADALVHSAIDDDELRRELGVIIQEAKRKLDNASAVAQESLFETMFDVHRIRRWRIGTEDVLRALTREDVWSYYRNLYLPSNIVLVIAGDVDPAHAFELAERHYGGMPAGEPVRDAPPTEPERTGFRFREMPGDIVHSYLEWGWRTPEPLHEDTPALDLLATVLGRGRASRLYRAVRDRGFVNSISAYNYTPSSVGVFGISAEMNPPDTNGALRAIARAVDAVRHEEVRAAELERAKNILEARLMRRLETAEGQANLLADWQALGDWRLADEYLERCLATDVSTLRRVADRYLAPERTTLLLYRPESAPAIGQSTDWLASELFGKRRIQAVPATPPVEDGVYRYELSNGVTAIIQPRQSALVSAAIAYRHGGVSEPPQLAGVTGLMMRTSVKGTETRTGAQLAEEIESLGGSIGPSPGADLFDWSVSVPARHVARALELLADAALAPIFPGDEIERERTVALSDLEQLRDDMARYPLRLLFTEAFRDHPYGTSIELLESSLRTLSRDDVGRWHRERVLHGEPWVFVVGDVDPEDVAREIETRMAAVRATPSEERLAMATWPHEAVSTTASRDKAQTAIAIGFPGVLRNAPEHRQLQLLSAAIAGLGGALFEELRSRRSLAYAVAAYPIGRLLGGAFVGYIGTSPEREEEAREGLITQLMRWTREELSVDELERAKRYTIGAWQIRSQTTGAQLADLVSAFLLGEGLTEIREFESRINAITAAQIREAAERCFDTDRLVTAIVRGTGKAR